MKNIHIQHRKRKTNENERKRKINGSTIEVYTPPVPSEIRSFVKHVLPKELKGIGTKIKLDYFKLLKGRPVHYP